MTLPGDFMGKRGSLDELLKIILWVVLFILLLAGIYMMFRRLA